MKTFYGGLPQPELALLSHVVRMHVRVSHVACIHKASDSDSEHVTH